MLDWKSLPSLSSLRAFDAVARHLNFSEAARTLNVTHAAISQQVRGLEQELGVALAERAGRSVALTEAGTTLAEALNDGFSGIARAVTSVKQAGQRRGLRVTTTPYIVNAVVMPRLSEFWAKRPGIEIALQPSAQYLGLAEEGYDLGIRGGDETASWPGLDAVVIAKTRWALLGSPDLIAREGRDIARLPWISTEHMSAEYAAIRRAGLDPDKLRKVELGSEYHQMAAARQGLGVCLASVQVARADIAEGRLIELPFPGDQAGAYFAVVPKGAQRPIVQDFIAWLQEIF